MIKVSPAFKAVADRMVAEDDPLPDGPTWNGQTGPDPPPPNDDFEADNENPAPAGDRADTKPRRTFAPVFLDDITVDDEPAYIVEGIIPAGPSFGEIPAPPKSLKSFFLADLLMHISIGQPYAGRAVQHGAVIYITSEGVQGVKRRLVAMRRYHGVEGKRIPFALVPVMPNLGSGTEDLETLKAEIAKAIEPLKVPLRAIVIDTLRRARRLARARTIRRTCRSFSPMPTRSRRRSPVSSGLPTIHRVRTTAAAAAPTRSKAPATSSCR
jgi:AAA domain